MKLLTMQEIALSIMEETRDVDPEITEGLILKEAVIPRSEIEKLQTKLHIGTLNQIFIELILSYNWGNFGFLSYQFGVNDEETLNWIVQRNLEYADYDILHQYDLMIMLMEIHLQSCWNVQQERSMQSIARPLMKTEY